MLITIRSERAARRRPGRRLAASLLIILGTVFVVFALAWLVGVRPGPLRVASAPGDASPWARDLLVTAGRPIGVALVLFGTFQILAGVVLARQARWSRVLAGTAAIGGILIGIGVVIVAALDGGPAEPKLTGALAGLALAGLYAVILAGARTVAPRSRP